MSDIASRITALGEREERGSHEPFWNHEPRVFRYVQTGTVDVFAVRREGDAACGARRHVFRARSGTILPGIDPAAIGHNQGENQGFLAVCGAGTVLWRCGAADFNRLAADEEAAAGMLELADGWIGALTRGLPRGTPPTEFEILSVDAPTEAPAERLLAPTERVVWVRVLEGRASFMGNAAAQVAAAGVAAPIPVRNEVWLQVIEPVRVEAVDPRVLAAEGRLWESLTEYHRLALAYFLAAARASDEAEALRLAAKSRRSQGVMSEALDRVLRVVAGGASEAPDLPGSDPLLAALAPLGRHQAIQFRLPKGGAVESAMHDRVQGIADASQVRVRRVALKGEWWTADSGPLLGLHRESRQWLALVPRADSTYELHDAVAGTVRRVDEEVAAELGDFAYSFYRALPARKLNALDLLRFGAHGLWRDIGWIVSLSALTGILGLLIPIASGKLIDTFIPSADRSGVWMTTGALIAASIASAMFGIARSIAVLRAESKMDGAVQSAVWDRLLKLPVPFFRDYSAGDLAMRINGVNTIRHALSGSTIGTLLTGIFSILTFALLFYYSAKLAFVALGITGVALTVTLACGLARLRYERQMAEVAGRLSGMVFQYLTGIPKLRVASAETRAFANWVREFTRLRRLAFAAAHVGNIQGAFYSVYGPVSTAIVFAVVGMVLVAETGTRFSTGEFVAFNAAFGSFFSALLSMASTLIGLLNLVPVYARARPILETLPEVDESKAHPGQLAGGIEVVKLGFQYRDGPQVLKDVTFSIRPGGYIALVGPSGSGKSTLFRLLLGFEKPSAGSIYYDSQDLADLDVHSIRKQIGVVLQGGQLITGDIFTNIVGASQLSIDDAWEAVRLCGLEEDIQKMPMGLHTVVSEGSSTLSGGQRQRILIARAIVHRPRIIFFDEATSALDNRTQAIVSRSLETLKATRLVIGHRLSTVLNADRIIVLKDGAVVQNGAYQKLLNEPGPFADMAKRQLA